MQKHKESFGDKEKLFPNFQGLMNFKLFNNFNNSNPVFKENNENKKAEKNLFNDFLFSNSKPEPNDNLDPNSNYCMIKEEENEEKENISQNSPEKNNFHYSNQRMDKEFQIIKSLSSSKFIQVFKCQNLLTNEIQVVKKINKLSIKNGSTSKTLPTSRIAPLSAIVLNVIISQQCNP